jgi:hypothetical protein
VSGALMGATLGSAVVLLWGTVGTVLVLAVMFVIPVALADGAMEGLVVVVFVSADSMAVSLKTTGATIGLSVMMDSMEVGAIVTMQSSDHY